MTSDPIEAMRNAITHAHRRHKDKASGLYQPLKSDLEVGVDFLCAAARYRVHLRIDDMADVAHELLQDDIAEAYHELCLLRSGDRY